MRCICKLFALDRPAKDGSVIPTDVCRTYIESSQCKEDLEKRKMLGSLTHRARMLSNLGENMRSSTISKSIGADDMALLPEPGCSCPTHYIEKMWIENGWLMGSVKILDEEGMDDIGKNYIRRVKGLLKQGVKLPGSLCIVSYWEAQPGTNQDFAKSIQRIKGYDWTLCESSIGAGVDEIINDEGERIFSSTSSEDYPIFDGKVKVKTFSSPSEAGIDLNLPKSSKINGRIAVMKAKEFSLNGSVEFLSDDSTNPVVTEEQKEFSVSSIKERVRYAKFSPRQRFRRLVMEYKAVVKSMGGPEKIDEETMKVMKSLFATDVLDIMKSITPDIMAGKPIGTLIGASSLGKNIRVTTQKMQMPMKMALQQAQKQSYVTKNIYEKIQALYIQFIGELTEEVFSSKSTIPDLKPGEEVGESEENNNE